MTQTQENGTRSAALAAGAHPDDIEFTMAGTLLLLRQAGYEIHMLNLSNGYLGSDSESADVIAAQRWEEARRSASLAGAVMHPPVTRDIDILYTRDLIERTAAVIRRVNPSIMLVPSPVDYMEDHQTACRLLMTAAFIRNMRNFVSMPPEPACFEPLAVYHAMPHGLRTPLRQIVRPGQFVDVTPVMAQKVDMLACHASQKEWLDRTQGMDAYLTAMEDMNRDVGGMSGRFEYAEGWRRHLHYGFGPEDFDPLGEALGDSCWTDPAYEESLGSV